MRFAWLFFGLTATATATAACGGAVAQDTGGSPPVTTSPGAPAGERCTLASDCASGTCIFPVSDYCVAHGTCYAPPTSTRPPFNCVNVPVVEACGCDGSRVMVAQDPQNACGAPYPNGYAPAPISYFGRCNLGAPPPATCTTDTDCGAGRECGFAQNLACSAQGSCMSANQGNNCNAYLPGCACDGTEVNLACNGYPSGYSAKPLAHTGACTPVVTGGG